MLEKFEKKNWLFIKNNSAEESKNAEEQEINRDKNGTLGKYLFYSDDKDALIKLAEKLLIKYNLYEAKINIKKNFARKDFGFVLCVYDVAMDLFNGGRHKKEMRQYADNKKILYRYWKYDKDTLEGKYSKEYVNCQNEKLK